MKYIVYLTINLINNKIYIGVHGTENPNKWDHYLGCAVFDNVPNSYNKRQTPFQCAVAKYGPKNFHRKTLRVFDNLQDALDLERWLVCPSFIERTDTYNITLGGGMPPTLEKHIYQYDLDGNFVKEWQSIISISTNFNCNKDRIRMVIDDKRSFEASYWTEEYYEKLDTKEYRPSSRGSIRQYTTYGKFLKSFKNTTEAAKALDIDRSKITNAIYGKYATSGFWFLKEGETIESYLDGSIKNSPKIYQYNVNGDFIKVYENIKVLKKEFKCNKKDLERAIKNSDKFFDYYWSYSRYDNILLENLELEQKTPRKIYQFTLEGDFIREWDSITECRKQFPSVLQVCLGKRNHCHKFKFSFDKPKI